MLKIHLNPLDSVWKHNEIWVIPSFESERYLRYTYLYTFIVSTSIYILLERESKIYHCFGRFQETLWQESDRMELVEEKDVLGLGYWAASAEVKIETLNCQYPSEQTDWLEICAFSTDK